MCLGKKVTDYVPQVILVMPPLADAFPVSRSALTLSYRRKIGNICRQAGRQKTGV